MSDNQNNQPADNQGQGTGFDSFLDSIASDLDAGASSQNQQTQQTQATPASETQQGAKPAVADTGQTPVNQTSSGIVDTNADAEGEDVFTFDSLSGDAADTALSDEQRQEASRTEKLKEYEELEVVLQNPLAKYALDFVKSGNNSFGDFVKAIGGPDIADLPMEEGFRVYLEQIEKLTDPVEIETRLREFTESPESFQVRQYAQVKEALLQARNAKLKQLGLDLRTQAQQKKQAAIEGVTTMKEYSKKLLGKKILGIEITQDIVNDVEMETQNSFALFDPKVGFLVERSWRANFYEKYATLIANQLKSNAKHAGRQEVINEVVAASDSTRSRNTSQAVGRNEEVEVEEAVSGFLKDKAAIYQN